MTTFVCLNCGEETPKHNARQTHCAKPACRRAKHAASHREWRSKNLATARAYSAKYFATHKTQVTKYRHKYMSTACSKCGAALFTAKKKADRQGLLCKVCRGSRRLEIEVACHLCEQPLIVAASSKSKKHYHSSCHGAYTNAGHLLSLSRERIRQLVEAGRQEQPSQTRQRILTRLIRKRLG